MRKATEEIGGSADVRIGTVSSAHVDLLVMRLQPAGIHHPAPRRPSATCIEQAADHALQKTGSFHTNTYCYVVNAVHVGAYGCMCTASPTMISPSCRMLTYTRLQPGFGF